MNTTYPPPTSTISFPPLTPRIFPDLSPNELPSSLPSLPFPARTSPFSRYDLTTHLTPSARPRASPTATSLSCKLRPPHPPIAINDPSAEARAQRAKDVDKLMSRMMEQRGATMGEPSWTGDPKEEPQLWNAINRFVLKEPRSKESGPPVTLLFAHANGFPKEIWETVIDRLTQIYPAVDEILVWETVNHGDSALVNAGHLGDTFDWADNARDVLQFLLYHRPLHSDGPVPTHLPPHPAESTSRQIVGVGHSLGGGTLTRVALQKPELFSALILVDPIIIAEHRGGMRSSEISRFTVLIRGAIARRAVWPSMEEARTSFLRSPFFQAWHPAVLESYIKFGLAPVRKTVSDAQGESEGAVMLKQSPYDEAAVFAEPRAQAETYFLLPTLPERVELRWIMNGKGADATGGEAYTQQTVWRRPANSSNVRVLEAGHLIAQEAPDRLADEIADVLKRRFGTPKAEKAAEGIKSRL